MLGQLRLLGVVMTVISTMLAGALLVARRSREGIVSTPLAAGLLLSLLVIGLIILQTSR